MDNKRDLEIGMILGMIIVLLAVGILYIIINFQSSQNLKCLNQTQGNYSLGINYCLNQTQMIFKSSIETCKPLQVPYQYKNQTYSISFISNNCLNRGAG